MSATTSGHTPRFYQPTWVLPWEARSPRDRCACDHGATRLILALLAKARQDHLEH
jgi:hypothetical protein